jgi:SagB-type dehydrogenase family enzyme
VPADFLAAPPASLLDLYLIVHAVEGLAPGAYVHHRAERALERLREGHFRLAAGRLALGQALAADAAVNVYSLARLPRVLDRFGNRGYRAAQLEGGITGGRLYHAAYALGFGATGLTVFDDEVTDFFSPHAAGKSVMFLTALGRPDRAALGLRQARS